jgi:hypothetical protein
MSDIVLLKSTSSGPDGYSVQSGFLGCGMAASLREQSAITEKAEGVVWAPYEELDKKPVATLAGTIWGHLTQAYSSGQPVNPSAKFHWELADGQTQDLGRTHPETVKEALRVYDAYTKEYAPNHWGEVIGVEVPCEIPAELFGRRMTGAIDMPTRDARGVWINDFKLIGREESTLWEAYSLRHQGHLYALAWELMTGEKVAGVRYIAGIKTKVPKFRALEYDGITEQRFRWLKNFFDTVEMKRANIRPEPSEKNCLAYGRPCVYLVNGMCSHI